MCPNEREGENAFIDDLARKLEKEGTRKRDGTERSEEKKGRRYRERG